MKLNESVYKLLNKIVSDIARLFDLLATNGKEELD